MTARTRRRKLVLRERRRRTKLAVREQRLAEALGASQAFSWQRWLRDEVYAAQVIERTSALINGR